MAPRRLDLLWLELQTKEKNSQENLQDFKQFIGIFNQLMSAQPQIDTIFGYRDALLDEILIILNNFETQNLKSEDYRQVLQSVLHIIKDLQKNKTSQQMSDQEYQKFVEICNTFVQQLKRELDTTNLRQTLKFIQYLFRNVDDLKFKMAEKGIFLTFLECIGIKDEECSDLLLKFLKIELVTTQETDEDADRFSLLSEPGDNENNTSFVTLIKSVKNKILNEIPSEYQQQLLAERDSDNPFSVIDVQDDKSPFAISKEIHEPLTSEQIDSMMTRQDSSISRSLSRQFENQNSRVLVLLRAGTFLKELKLKIENSEDSKLQLYVKIAYILNCFSSTNWAETEKQLLPSLLSRFTTSQNLNQTLIKLFQELILNITTSSLPESKIRNLNMFAFTLKIIETTKISAIKDALAVELKQLFILNQANPVIFFKEHGFKWLSKITLTDQLVELAKYLLHVLSDLQNDCRQYLIQITGRLLLFSNQADAKYVYSLLISYFQDLCFRKQSSEDDQIKQLFSNCIRIYMKDSLNSRVLFGTCIEYQLSVDQVKLFEDEQIKEIFGSLIKSVDIIDTYLASQLIKCMLQNGQQIEIVEIIQLVPLQNQTQFLRMLFVPKNNFYFDTLKQKLQKNEFFESEYQKFKDSFLMQQFSESTKSFLNLSILVSSCEKTKQYFDQLLQRDFDELVTDFCLSEFDNDQQRQIVQCLLVLHLETTGIENEIIWDYVKYQSNQTFTDFIQTTQKFRSLINSNDLDTDLNGTQEKSFLIKELQEDQNLKLRKINYSLLMLLAVKLTTENLIYLLKKLKEYCSSAYNRLTLIEAGFQQFLLQITELSKTLPRQEYLNVKQMTLSLLETLFEQSVLVCQTNAKQLLTPNLIPSITKILCQNSAPKYYSGNLVNMKSSQSHRLKLNQSLQENNNILQLSSGEIVCIYRSQQSIEESQNLKLGQEWSYQLIIGDFKFKLDQWINFGIFEVQGWNLYEVENNKLKINGFDLPEFSLQQGTTIGHSQTQIVYEEQSQNFKLEYKEQNYLTFITNQNQTESNSLESTKKTTVFGKLTQFKIQSFQIQDSSSSDLFGGNSDIQTLKEMLSNQETINLILQLLDKAEGDETIVLFMRFLTALAIKNNEKLQFDMERIIQAKIMEMHSTGINKILKLLIDFALDNVDASNRIYLVNDTGNFSNLTPRLVFPELLELPLRLLDQVPVEQGSKFIETIKLLLQNKESLVKFYEKFGVQPIIRIFSILRKNYRKEALYEMTISLFELFVDGTRLTILNTSFIKEIFDFLLKISLEDQNKMTSKIVIDCLSVIMIHLIVDETNSLLTQILSLDIIEFIYKILQSKIIEIREYTFKVICLFLSKSSKIQSTICYNTLCDLLSLQDQSMNLGMIILDASVGKFVNVNDLTPVQDSVVIQMMNASKSAQKIVLQITQSFKQKGKNSVIVNPGMIDCFLYSLSKVSNDVQRHMCLKQLTSMLIESNNIENIFDTNGCLQQFIENLFTFQIRITTNGDLSDDVKVFYENYLFEKHTKVNGLKGAGYSTTEDESALHTSGNKSESGKSNNDILPPIRTLDAILDLLTQIVARDIHKPYFQSQIYNIMLTSPHNDDRLQLQIVSRILRNFHRSPKVDDKNVLLNLYRIFSNLEKLMSQNDVVYLKVINLINLMAFKSTTDVRKLMQENKLLQLRDQLLVSQIRKTYLNPNEYLVQSLSLFNFESIASKQIFTQNCCTEYFVLIIHEAETKKGLQQVNCIDYSVNLKHRLATEICQFEANYSKLINLVEALKLSNLPEEIVTKAKSIVSEHLKEQLELKENFDQERIARRRVLIDEFELIEAKRRIKTKSVII